RAARPRQALRRPRRARGVGRRHARERPRGGADRRPSRVDRRPHPLGARRRSGPRRREACMNEGAAHVLGALRHAGSTLSGEALSTQLGVSRAQVWKHVEALRGLGYRVDGEPGGGYRLAGAPDRLYAEEVVPRLATRWLARDYTWLDETDSTNRVAAEL